MYSLLHFCNLKPVHVSSPTLSDVADVCRRLEQCVSAVHDWCTSRRLQLNPSKTEVIWFGSNANLDRLAVTGVTICLDQATIYRQFVIDIY